jgi:hypothetical protein
MNLNTVTALRHPASAAEIAEWRNGFAWLAGGTWLFSEPQPETDTLIDLGHLGWPALEAPRPPGSTSARPAASPSSIASRRRGNGSPLR